MTPSCIALERGSVSVTGVLLCRDLGQQVPIGTFFATIMPLSEGYLPATVFGDGWLGARATPPVACCSVAHQPVAPNRAPEGLPLCT